LLHAGTDAHLLGHAKSQADKAEANVNHAANANGQQRADKQRHYESFPEQGKVHCAR
jgi:hypothetical protein